MKTRAARLYGKGDIRLEEFDLREMGDGEILAKVVSDSLCMSSYKAAMQGASHKRVPDNVAEHPIIIGHEFCGEVVCVGKNAADKAQIGDRFTVQPTMFSKGLANTAGYSYAEYGGDATYIIIPEECLQEDCFLKFTGNAYYYGSLAEPMSCIIGGYHSFFHTKQGSYIHEMGIKPGGRMAIIGGAGPMGLGAVAYALHAERRPGMLLVTDADEERLQRSQALFPTETAKARGVALHFLNPAERTADDYLALSGGEGFDDVLVMAPTQSAVETGGAILGRDGCMNFFAGPVDTQFSAMFNFYNVHYNATHVCANSGGNTADIQEALEMMGAGRLNPSAMITHIGGLDAVPQATLHLPDIPGGKKLIYTQLQMPLTAIEDFAEKGKEDSLFAALEEIVGRNGGLWCPEAEAYLLSHGKRLQ